MNEVIRVSDKTKEKMIEYYKDKKKDNWNKVKSLAEINSILDSIFLEE